MSAPRSLAFDSVAEAPVEAARLMESGYERRGNWDLRQVCEHLADWIDFELDGYPSQPWPMRAALWAARRTVGPRILRKWLAAGAMPAGVQTDRRTVHPANHDRIAEAAAVTRLEASVDRFLAHQGEYVASPLFGFVSREDARRLHAIHCAHHLGFLEPK